MYLEIGERQCGKTTRLINQIQADKDNYDIQILMGMNNISLKAIKQKIKHNNKVKICLSFDSLISTIRSYDIYKDKKLKVRLYVDEFLYSTSFCNNFNDIKARFETEFDLISNGYFSSSLNSHYFIILRKLQEFNNNKLTLVHTTTNCLN